MISIYGERERRSPDNVKLMSPFSSALSSPGERSAQTSDQATSEGSVGSRQDYIDNVALALCGDCAGRDRPIGYRAFPTSIG